MLKYSSAAIFGRFPALVILSAALLTALLASGCAGGPKIVTPDAPPIPAKGAPVPDANKAVLTEGTQVIAKTGFGRIKIEAGPGMRRVFNWNGMRRGVVLKPREKQDAGGTKGLYFTGKPPVWAPANGVTQVKIREGYHSFENADDALIWMQIRRPYFTYNNHGLAVGWRRNGDTLEAEVWQFYIDGSMPTSMPKADDDSIVVGPLQAEPQKMKPQLVFADGHTEPYTAETAAKYSNATAGGAASASATGTEQASNCNWFKRLFEQCATVADTTKSTAQSETAQNDTKATTKTATASTPGTAPPANSPDASADKAGSTAEKQPQSGKDESVERAEIKAKAVNIRSGPSTDNKVLLVAKGGDSVVILKKDNDWSYVKFDDGRKGWVADFLLKH